ncbi:MAG: hypothetical protein WC820_09720 [Spirochaetales bacterium]|jgi:hypothetical protein
MRYELIVLAISCVLLLFVLIRISLTLNEISASLRRLAKRKSEQKPAVASTILRDAEDSSSADLTETEVAAAIAIARSALDRDQDLK